MSRTKRFFGAWFFPGVLIMLGSLALYLGVNDMVKGWTSHGWPSVEGVVIQSKIGLNAGKIGNSKQGEDQTFYADIRYAYAVGSEQHEGYRVSFGEFSDVDQSIATEILERYPVGRTVKVFYNPDRNRESVLEPGLHGYPWLFLVPAPIFIGLGYLMARYFPKMSA